MHAARKTPLSCGNVPGSNRKEAPQRRPKDRYDVASYRRAIARACDEAFPPPAPLARQEKETAKGWEARLTPAQREELAAWQRRHRWHPHQLRHNAATLAESKFTLEHAQAVLGHTTPAITATYANARHLKAQEVMRAIG